MKKIYFLFLLFATLSVSAQEVIIVGGAGYQKTGITSDGNNGNFAFIEGRIMINLTQYWRFGPYAGYVQYGANELNKTPQTVSLGKEFEYGLSVDNFGPIGYSHSHYFWLNSGLKDVRDHFKQGDYDSNSNTRLWFVSGGFFLTDDWKGWFGNNRLMWSYQKPIKSEVLATWQKVPLTNATPYNKESLKLTLESGLKRFGEKTVTIEPLFHAAYGQDFGRQKAYYELGGGLSFGIFKEWQRDIFKIKVFNRKDFQGKQVNNIQTPGGAWCGEAVLNISALYYAIKK